MKVISNKGDLKVVRKANKGLVLNMIMKHAQTSRVEISRNSRLSRTTVSDIVTELVNERLVIDEGVANLSKVGRKPSMLRFNPEAYYILTGDFGEVDTVTLGIVDLIGNVKERVELKVDVREKREVIFDDFVKKIFDMFNRFSLDSERIFGIGIAFPGEFNHEEGLSIFSPNYNWKNVPVRDLIEKKTGIRTFVDNDARLKSLGEFLYGGGRGANNMVYISVGNGVGSGIIMNGKIYRGSHNASGEIGHCPIIFDGYLCGCGHRGCLESVASGPAILSRVRTAIMEGKKTIISDYASPNAEGLIIDHVFQAADEGDEFALQVIKEVGFYIGIGVAYLMNTFDPDVILLGNYIISKGGERLLSIIKDVASERVFDISTYRTTKIEQAILGENAGIVGASALVCQEVFKSPLVFS